MQFKTHDIKTQLSSETHVFLPPSLQTYTACPSGLETEWVSSRGQLPPGSGWAPAPSAIAQDGYNQRSPSGVSLELWGSILQRRAEQSPAHPRWSSRLSAASVKMQAPPWEWPYFIPESRAVDEIIRARRMVIFVSADTPHTGHLAGDKSLTW